MPKEPTPEEKSEVKTDDTPKIDLTKPQTDFEDKFTPEIVAASKTETKSQSESIMSITSLAQGSGALVTIPPQSNTKEVKKKNPERFSLKTSIPISKIDMKCVSSPQDTVFQNSIPKKSVISTPSPNSAFQPVKSDSTNTRVEIQSNIVIKNAPKEVENKDKPSTPIPTPSNSISTLINAAEAVNKSELTFRKPDPKPEVVNEIKDPPPNFSPPISSGNRLFSPINVDTSKASFISKPETPVPEQKNQILFIQNKNATNPKMLLTIQQQNPQVLLQRTSYDPKNLQTPSRLSSQSKKSNEDLVDKTSKVVALKRLHQENCDENDFENLITENQIYGNKIVVKEKLQCTSQEQDLKNKMKVEKTTHAETKNVVLQPNILYLSNVQFPNLMMIKNNGKLNQSVDPKGVQTLCNDKMNDVSTMTNANDAKKLQNVSASKDIHVLKSNNNAVVNKNAKTDVIFQTSHQKVIMNPQIVYQVPMIVDGENKHQPFMNNTKFISQSKKEYPKPYEPTKSNDKLYIACPYQMDSKLQPKIVITNLRPKMAKVEEVSLLDSYERKRRLRRQKYLTNRDTKEPSKIDTKKVADKVEVTKNIITPDNVKMEIYKEFSNTRVGKDDGTSESESEYGDEELEIYNSLISEYSAPEENDKEKIDFLSGFQLATLNVYKEKQLDRQESSLRRDAVASAYIAAGRLDRLAHDDVTVDTIFEADAIYQSNIEEAPREHASVVQKKQSFLSQLKLAPVSEEYKEDYERSWQEILKERRRRNGIAEPEMTLKLPKYQKNIDFDTNNQLQIMTEIKRCVNDNNNLIKKRLDLSDTENEGDSIRLLAEKNFSELNRLSKMADRSVKLITGQDARKRDLNPGFDSENIKKTTNYPNINIPNISKIISLKSQECVTSAVTSQATSMDEPVNSAAGVSEMFEGSVERVREVGCQVEDTISWPGIHAVMKSYKEFEAARKREINELHRRNTALRVEGAHITRAASQQADRARALLAERQLLAAEEAGVRGSLLRLRGAIDAVKRTA